MQPDDGRNVCTSAQIVRVLFIFRGSVEACLLACLRNRMWCLSEPSWADLETIHQSFPDKSPSRKKSTNLSRHGKRHPGAPLALSMKLLWFRASHHLSFPAWFLPDSTGLCLSLQMSGSRGCLLNRQLPAWAVTPLLLLLRCHPWVRHFPQRNPPSMGLL